jgi:hypothetical protein
LSLINLSKRFSSIIRGPNDLDLEMLVKRSNGIGFNNKSVIFLSLDKATKVKPKLFSERPKSITALSSVSS